MKEHFADGDVLDITTAPNLTVGATGLTGDMGPQGIKGLAGAPGAVGAKGDKGDKGVINLSAFTFSDRVPKTDTTAAVPSKMILPSTLCVGTECVTGSDYDSAFKPAGCNLYLWDAPPTYRDYSSMWGINNFVPFSTNPSLSWRTLIPEGNMSTWGCGMLEGPCTAWHPSSNDNNQWQIIYTEPKLSQKVKGIRILSRKDAWSNYNDYITGFYLTYKPLDNNTLDPKLIDKTTGEVAVVPGKNDTMAPDGKSFYFKDTGAWGGIELFFDAPIECKYVRLTYTYHTRYAVNRSGLYLCI